MANDYTTADLLTEVRQRAMLTTDQNTWDSPAILREADSVVRTHCMARLRNFGMGYQETFVDYTVSPNTSYPVPPRTMGQVRDVQYTQGDDERSLATLAQLSTPQEAERGIIVGGYFRLSGDRLFLANGMTQGLLRVYYFLRPGRLVEVSNCAEVVSIAGAVITCTAAPPTGFVTGARVDLISLEPPSFRPRLIDAEIQGVSGSDITLAAAPAGTQVPLAGEFVALSGQSPVPQVPLEMHSYVAQHTAVNILLSQKPTSQLAQGAQLRLKDEVQAMRDLLSPRVSGEPEILVNRSSPLRLAGTGYYRRGRW